MLETPPEITRVVEPESFPMKPAERFTSLFFSPSALMQNIKNHPKILLPLLICMLISLATLPLVLRYADIQLQQYSIASIDRYGVDFFNMGGMYDDEVMAAAMNTVTIVTTAFGLLISYPLTAAISALLLFVLCKIMRSPGKFPQYFSLYVHVYIITSLCGIITMGACVLFDNVLDVLSLAAVLMPEGNNSNTIFNLLSAISIPGIWMAVLVIIGVKHINSWSYTKATIAGMIAFTAMVIYTGLALGAMFYMYDLMEMFGVLDGLT